MKKLRIIICLLTICFTASAQTGLFSNENEVFMQMWNTAAPSYTGVTKLNKGTQRDTKASGVTTYLTSAAWNQDYSVVKASPIPGVGGNIGVTVAAYRANLTVTTNPTVTVSVEVSDDSLIWVSPPGYTSSILTPALTNSVIPTCARWEFTSRTFAFARAKVVVNADSVKFAAFYHSILPYFITK